MKTFRVCKIMLNNSIRMISAKYIALLNRTYYVFSCPGFGNY